MQLATPFLIPSATIITERTSKKTQLQLGSQNQEAKKNLMALTIEQQTTLETAVEDTNELAHQNLARLLASCGDCV